MDSEVRRLIDRARRAGPTASAKERLRARILAASAGVTVTTATSLASAKIAASAGTAAATASVPVAAASSSATAALLSAALAPLAVGVLLGTAAMSPLWLASPRGNVDPVRMHAVSSSRSSTSSASGRVSLGGPVQSAVSASSPSAAAASSTAPRIESPSATVSEPRSAPPRSPTHAGTEVSVPSIQRETLLLAEAQRALSRGDAQSALRQLDSYEREFPAGVLREEAAAVRVLALCASKSREREYELNAFAARYPTSPLLARARAACRHGKQSR